MNISNQFHLKDVTKQPSSYHTVEYNTKVTYCFYCYYCIICNVCSYLQMSTNSLHNSKVIRAIRIENNSLNIYICNINKAKLGV